MTTQYELPHQVELLPNHIGAIGEALFEATYGPPAPLPSMVQEFTDEFGPEWIDIDQLNIQSLSTDEEFYTVKIDGDEMTWQSDGEISAWYRPAFEERQKDANHAARSWNYLFPVEIKTGKRARLENDQREVMSHVAKQDGYQPILIRLSIDDLPDAFTIENVEFI